MIYVTMAVYGAVRFPNFISIKPTGKRTFVGIEFTYPNGTLELYSSLN